jgi:hypothetical protein
MTAASTFVVDVSPVMQAFIAIITLTLGVSCSIRNDARIFPTVLARASFLLIVFMAI